MCSFGSKLKSQLILLFSLFFLMFMDPTVLFYTIHKSYYTISINFYIYLPYFQQQKIQFQQNKQISNKLYEFKNSM